MVLADLGRKLNAALSALNRAPIVDEKVYLYVMQFCWIWAVYTFVQIGSRCYTKRDHRSPP